MPGAVVRASDFQAGDPGSVSGRTDFFFFLMISCYHVYVLATGSVSVVKYTLILIFRE